MLPRLRIANLPTPLEPLPRLTTSMGGPKLLIKRDDLTGLAFGGNKIRKLEYLLAEAQANGARMLLTAGAIQSNHCRQTAAAAARFGFGCKLILTGEPPAKKVGNTLLDGLLGADIIWTSLPQRDAVLKATFDSCWEEGQRPYLIPYGGSNATGVAAYTSAFKELIDQQPDIDWIVFASSSGGTQAGLSIGSTLHGWKGRILGISVDEPASRLNVKVTELIEAGCRKMDINLPHSPILVNDDYLGGGYAVMGEAEKEAIHLFARTEGILLDPVYTGRAGAGLIDLIRQGFFKKGETVVFWHTGGTPALFDPKYSSKLQ